MSGIYYVEAAELLREAGLTVVECAGWQTRARSSGGFAAPPLGVQWHHTASKTTPENDTAWQCEGSDDAPIGNATIMRDGSVWMIAAGAANTAGKGGPITFSRGTVPKDSGNTTTWAFEVANNGVGEPWPQVQIDAYFIASNVMNAHFGNKPTDLFTHKSYTDASCPGRKIDPATATAVQGPWRPRSDNASGSWNVDDIKAEASRRAGSAPPPQPDPEEDDVLSDDDINRIAKAVWQLKINDAVTGQPQNSASLLSWTRRDAAAAAGNTKAQASFAAAPDGGADEL